MPHKDTQLQSGVIIVTDPDKDFRALTIPAQSNGGTFTLELRHGDTKLSTPRQIQMDDIPSATLITLKSRDKDRNGYPEWWLTLKTTHHTAKLNPHDINYFVNSYDERDFIKEGLGIVVVGKSESIIVLRDTLGTVIVETSPTPPTH